MGSLSISYPAIGGDATQQMYAVKSYLYQLTDQLNLADWSAHKILSDIGSAIDASESSEKDEETKGRLQEAAALKSLIIKTADYAAANSETFKMSLRSDYVAVSDFGKYFEDAEVEIEGTAVGISQLYSYSSGIRSDMEDVNVGVNTYIKTGLLYYDDIVPVYGVGVGNLATTVTSGGEKILDRTNLMATFTAEEIAFWAGGNKRAYITPTSVYFPSAEISGGSINIGNGRFKVDSAGNLSATGASITGAITATSLDIRYANISGSLSADMISGGTLDCDTIYVQGLDVTDSMISSVSCDKLTDTLAAARFAASTIGAGCLSGGTCSNYLIFTDCNHRGGNLGTGLTFASGDAGITSSPLPGLWADSYQCSIYSICRAGIWWDREVNSDARVKHAIEDLDAKYEALFDALRPCRFIYDSDTSGTYQVGYVAQEVRQALENAGLTMREFGALTVDNEDEWNERYHLSKMGMVPLHTMEIQKLKARVAKLEAALSA